MATAETHWREPVIGPEQNYATVSEHLSDLVLVQRTPLWWYAGFGVSMLLFLWLVVAAVYLLANGIGVWGV